MDLNEVDFGDLNDGDIGDPMEEDLAPLSASTSASAFALADEALEPLREAASSLTRRVVREQTPFPPPVTSTSASSSSSTKDGSDSDSASSPFTSESSAAPPCKATVQTNPQDACVVSGPKATDQEAGIHETCGWKPACHDNEDQQSDWRPAKCSQTCKSQASENGTSD